jgi:hypothetical protein
MESASSAAALTLQNGSNRGPCGGPNQRMLAKRNWNSLGSHSEAWSENFPLTAAPLGIELDAVISDGSRHLKGLLGLLRSRRTGRRRPRECARTLSARRRRSTLLAARARRQFDRRGNYRRRTSRGSEFRTRRARGRKKCGFSGAEQLCGRSIWLNGGRAPAVVTGILVFLTINAALSLQINQAENWILTRDCAVSFRSCAEPAAVGRRENSPGRDPLPVGVLLSSPVAFGGTFCSRRRSRSAARSMVATNHAGFAPGVISDQRRASRSFRLEPAARENARGCGALAVGVLLSSSVAPVSPPAGAPSRLHLQRTRDTSPSTRRREASGAPRSPVTKSNCVAADFDRIEGYQIRFSYDLGPTILRFAISPTQVPGREELARPESAPDCPRRARAPKESPRCQV